MKLKVTCNFSCHINVAIKLFKLQFARCMMEYKILTAYVMSKES